MPKIKSTVLILGILILCVGTALITFLVLSFSGAVVTDPVLLEFKVEDREKIYDGTPLTADEYTLTSGELLQGHRALVSFTGSQTDAGESESGMSVKIVDENDYDVTNRYAVKVNGGTLSVEKCEVYIRLDDSQVVYNGKTIIFDDYTLATGSLASGHRVGATKTSGITSVSDVLTLDDVSPAIYDENGRDVTENYDLHFRMGDVCVVARPVAFQPLSAEKIYDGEPLTCAGCEITGGSLVRGHRAEFTYNSPLGQDPELRDVGEITVYADVTIYDEDGADVTDNYEIDREKGATLVVKKRDLKLTALSGSWEYDGREHSLADKSEPALAEGLVQGDRVAVVYEDAILNAGTAVNEIKSCDLGEAEGNYVVSFVPGTLTVTKKKIAVQMTGGVKEYDGMPLTLADAAYECAEADLTILSSNLTGIRNAGEYNFTAVFDDNNGNYEISVKSATYVITKLEISLTYTGITQKVYDGTPFTVDCSLISLDCTNAERYEVVSVTCNHVYMAGTAPLNIRYPQIVIRETGAPLSAASLSVAPCETPVTVTPKSLSLAVINLTFSEGTSDSDIEAVVMKCNPLATPLCDGDEYDSNLISIFYNSTTKAVDIIVGKGTIRNALGEDVTNCYQFTETYSQGYVAIVPNS